MALDFLKKKKPQIGLDITADGITAVSLNKKNKNIILKNAAYEPFNEQVIQNGLICNGEAFTRTLKKLLEENGFNEKTVNIAVPSTAVLIKTISLPDLPMNELHMIAAQEAEKHISMPIKDVNIDFQILNDIKKQDDSNKKIDIVLVALSKSTASNYVEHVSGLNLDVSAIDVAPFAMIRTLANMDAINEPSAVYISVLIGYENTDINIIQEGMPFFSNNIHIGKKNVIDSIIHSLGVDNGTAESMLTDIALIIPGMNVEELDPQLSKAAAIVRTIYNNISSEIQKTIEFYSSQNTEYREIKTIILGGSGICIQNIDKYIANRLKIETILCNPFINLDHNIEYGESLISPVNIPSFATSVGLALKGLAN